MKVAVSIPDAVFNRAESMARRRNMSRSALYAYALEQLEDEPCDNELTRIANALADSMTDEDREEQQMIMQAGARTVLKHTSW